MKFTGATYVGLHTADGKRPDVLGEYTFASGDRYVGGMRDGVFHGEGTLFFRRRTAAASALSRLLDGQSAADADDDDGDDDGDDDAWEGQLRGVWRDGVNISGRYVFADGLVYSSADDAKETPSDALPHWPYGDAADRRLWVEHLRGAVPLLPHEAVLGGAGPQELVTQQQQPGTRAARQTPSAATEEGDAATDTATAAAAAAASPAEGAVAERPTVGWMAAPVLAPHARAAESIPPAFMDGQPRSGAEAARWTGVLAAEEAAQRAAMVTGSDEFDSAHGVHTRSSHSDGTRTLPASLAPIHAALAHRTLPLVSGTAPDPPPTAHSLDERNMEPFVVEVLRTGAAGSAQRATWRLRRRCSAASSAAPRAHTDESGSDAKGGAEQPDAPVPAEVTVAAEIAQFEATATSPDALHAHALALSETATAE